MALHQLRINRNLFFTAIVFWFTINIAEATIYTVTVTSDNPFTPAIGSLRWAINQVNAGAGTGDVINFNISGTGFHVIALSASLPVINKSVTIDGTTQSGYQTGQPTVIVDGGSVTTLWWGLLFNYTSNITVKGMHLKNFYEAISGTNSGSSTQSYQFLIQNNVLTSNVYGLRISRDIQGNLENVIVKGNYIDANSTPYQSFSEGIFIYGKNYIIGGYASGEANSILNNQRAIWIYHSNSYSNRVTENIIISSLSSHLGIDLTNGANQNKPAPANLSYSLGVLSGTAQANDRVEIFGATDGQNANVFLAATNANGSGNWSANVASAGYAYLTTTATDQSGSQSPNLENTSELSNIYTGCNTFSVIVSPDSATICRDSSVTLQASGASSYTWQPAIGLSSTTGAMVIASPTITTTYTVTGTSTNCSGTASSIIIVVDTCFTATLPCVNCIGSFAPEPGKKYVLSAWAKEANAPANKVSYDRPQIFIDYTGSGTSSGPFIPKGLIIDGWQHIEEEFTIPANTTHINIRLQCQTGDCFFDDIRIHPFDGSMKTFVFDPVTLRLAAELDERNYATLYEYDEEGKLIRVKKETERGVMTIQENKNSMRKQ